MIPLYVVELLPQTETVKRANKSIVFLRSFLSSCLNNLDVWLGRATHYGSLRTLHEVPGDQCPGADTRQGYVD